MKNEKKGTSFRRSQSRSDGLPSFIVEDGPNGYVGEYETPELEQLEEWCFDSVVEALDGCEVEPDGMCPHGYPSWLLVLGLI